MEAGEGENVVAFRDAANWRRPQSIGVRHGTSSIVGTKPVATLQADAASGATQLVYSSGDTVFYLRGRIFGEGAAEILHDVKAVTIAYYAEPNHVVRGIEQVRAMGRRQHEMFMPMLGVIIERNVLALLLELEVRCGREALRQCGLAIELVRETPRFEHGLRMHASSL